MCLYTNILKYTTRIPTKLKKVLKNDLQLGPEAPQCNMREKPLQKPFTPLLGQSISWTWSDFVSAERPIILGTSQTSSSALESRYWLMSSSTESTFSSCHCYSIHHRRVSCFLSDVYMRCYQNKLGITCVGDRVQGREQKIPDEAYDDIAKEPRRKQNNPVRWISE